MLYVFKFLFLSIRVYQQLIYKENFINNFNSINLNINESNILIYSIINIKSKYCQILRCPDASINKLCIMQYY